MKATDSGIDIDTEYDNSIALRAWAHHCGIEGITTCVYTQPNEEHLRKFNALSDNTKKLRIAYVLDNNWFPPFNANPVNEWDGVDMDGTLSEYDTTLSPWEYGKPIPGIVDNIRARISSGRTVKIFTARACPKNNPFYKDCIRGAKEWAKKHIGYELEVTHEKDVNMKELLDDRVTRVNYNEGTLCSGCMVAK